MGGVLAAVCFDLMGTLLRDPYREALEAATGLRMDQAHRLKDPQAWPDFETGAIDEPTFVRRFFTTEEVSLDLVAFHRERRRGYRWLPGMRELLGDLEGKAERYIASNYPVWIEELRQRFDLDQRTEGVWASHHFGVRKPASSFYECLLEEIGHPAEVCLFVDDRPDNCEGAQAAGMPAHLFTGPHDLRRRLQAEGLDV